MTHCRPPLLLDSRGPFPIQTKTYSLERRAREPAGGRPAADWKPEGSEPRGCAPLRRRSHPSFRRVIEEGQGKGRSVQGRVRLRVGRVFGGCGVCGTGRLDSCLGFSPKKMESAGSAAGRPKRLASPSGGRSAAAPLLALRPLRFSEHRVPAFSCRSRGSPRAACGYAGAGSCRRRRVRRLPDFGFVCVRSRRRRAGMPRGLGRRGRAFGSRRGP